MSKELTVYKQLTLGTKECLEVIKREIGMKSTCAPFAEKLLEALSDLSPSLRTEQEQLKAATVLLSHLQTLMQAGITAEDYDKIDFVKRGKTIVPSARVEAFYLAASRKGYRITEKIVAVPQEDFNTTYFRERFYNGDYFYDIEDKHFNSDRAITAQRLVDRYFLKFLCRLDIKEVKSNELVATTTEEVYIDDLLNIAATSEQGLYKSKWEEYIDGYGRKRKRKVVTSELNTDTFWIKWTGEMVKKTVIRRALKRIKEVLPELTETIYAFEQDEYIETENKPVEIDQVGIEIPVETEDVNLNKLTAEQMADCKEVLELWKANPKLAEDKLNEVKDLIESGKPAQEIINEDYASIYCLKLSKAKWAEIGGYFDEKS